MATSTRDFDFVDEEKKRLAVVPRRSAQRCSWIVLWMKERTSPGRTGAARRAAARRGASPVKVSQTLPAPKRVDDLWTTTLLT